MKIILKYAQIRDVKNISEECIRKGYCTECSADIFYDY